MRKSREPGKGVITARSHAENQGMKPLPLPASAGVLWALVSPPMLWTGQPGMSWFPYSLGPTSIPIPAIPQRGNTRPPTLPDNPHCLLCAQTRPESGGKSLDPDSPRPPPGCSGSVCSHSPGGDMGKRAHRVWPYPCLHTLHLLRRV